MSSKVASLNVVDLVETTQQMAWLVLTKEKPQSEQQLDQVSVIVDHHHQKCVHSGVQLTLWLLDPDLA